MLRNQNLNKVHQLKFSVNKYWYSTILNENEFKDELKEKCFINEK